MRLKLPPLWLTLVIYFLSVLATVYGVIQVIKYLIMALKMNGVKLP